MIEQFVERLKALIQAHSANEDDFSKAFSILLREQPEEFFDYINSVDRLFYILAPLRLSKQEMEGSSESTSSSPLPCRLTFKKTVNQLVFQRINFTRLLQEETCFTNIMEFLVDCDAQNKTTFLEAAPASFFHRCFLDEVHIGHLGLILEAFEEELPGKFMELLRDNKLTLKLPDGEPLPRQELEAKTKVWMCFCTEELNKQNKPEAHKKSIDALIACFLSFMELNAYGESEDVEVIDEACLDISSDRDVIKLFLSEVEKFFASSLSRLNRSLGVFYSFPEVPEYLCPERIIKLFFSERTQEVESLDVEAIGNLVDAILKSEDPFLSRKQDVMRVLFEELKKHSLLESVFSNIWQVEDLFGSRPVASILSVKFLIHQRLILLQDGVLKINKDFSRPLNQVNKSTLPTRGGGVLKIGIFAALKERSTLPTMLRLFFSIEQPRETIETYLEGYDNENWPLIFISAGDFLVQIKEYLEQGICNLRELNTVVEILSEGVKIDDGFYFKHPEIEIDIVYRLFTILGKDRLNTILGKGSEEERETLKKICEKSSPSSLEYINTLPCVSEELIDTFFL